jgi:hypothetical protein
MAIAVISGLTVSTLLTLIVIPSAYAIVEQLLDRLRGRAPGRAAPEPATSGAEGTATSLAP